MSGWAVLRPLFDPVTQDTFDEAADVLAYMQQKGVETVDLAKGDCVRARVEALLNARPDLNVHHADHGNVDRWYGNDEQPCVDLQNVQLLKAREVYCNNCSSAKTLGVEAFKAGCLAYWGYTGVVSYTTDALEEFKEAFNYGLKRRIDGLTWAECLAAAKQRMTELVNALVASGRVLAATCLRDDRDILVCYTPESPPQSTCAVRRFLIRVLGVERGWRVRWPQL